MTVCETGGRSAYTPFQTEFLLFFGSSPRGSCRGKEGGVEMVGESREKRKTLTDWAQWVAAFSSVARVIIDLIQLVGT